MRLWLSGYIRAMTEATPLELVVYETADGQSLGGGLHELRIDHGPGYRVYFGRAGVRVILLLSGGTKRAQSRDIEQARSYWMDYRSRTQ